MNSSVSEQGFRERTVKSRSNLHTGQDYQTQMHTIIVEIPSPYRQLAYRPFKVVYIWQAER